LIAFGNEASDVITTLVASGESDGIEFAYGAIVGSGLFVYSCVFSFVVIFAGKVKVNRENFIRDISVYIGAFSILLIFSAIKEINIYMSIGFFLIWVV